MKLWWTLIQSITNPCCAPVTLPSVTGLWSWSGSWGGCTASHPRIAVFLLILHKLLFCQAHLDVLKQQCGILAHASASWDTNVHHSTLVTEFHAGFGTWPTCKGEKNSQDDLLHLLVLEPAHHPSDSWRSDTGRYLPVNPDKKLHIRTCYLWLKEKFPPLASSTKQDKEEKRSHHILNAEMLREEQQVKDWIINSFPDSWGSSLQSCTCTGCGSGQKALFPPSPASGHRRQSCVWTEL